MEAKKHKGKWIALAVVLGVLLILVLADVIMASAYKISVTSVSPDPVPADGVTQCELVVKVTDFRGKAQVGHKIYVRIKSGGGNFSQQRNTTDENGEIILNFKPVRASKYNPATNVIIEIRDESNSIFFFIPARIQYEIKVEE